MKPLIAIVIHYDGTAELMIQILGDAYRVERFRNGEEFLDGFHLEIDGVILDMHLPVMDGFDTLREMKSIGINVPVISVSGAVASSEIPGILALGAKEYVAIPFDIGNFRAVVVGAIG